MPLRHIIIRDALENIVATRKKPAAEVAKVDKWGNIAIPSINNFCGLVWRNLEIPPTKFISPSMMECMNAISTNYFGWPSRLKCRNTINSIDFGWSAWWNVGMSSIKLILGSPARWNIEISLQKWFWVTQHQECRNTINLIDTDHRNGDNWTERDAIGIVQRQNMSTVLKL